jgi:hypothetical protein
MTRGNADLIVRNQNRTKAKAVCDGWSGWAKSRREAGATSLLTCARTWSIVLLDLAIEDIRAREYRGPTGSLASMKVVSEAPTPGAKLITRRSQVRVLAPLQNRRSEAIRASDLFMPNHALSARFPCNCAV